MRWLASRSIRIGRLVIWLDWSKRELSRSGPRTNSPYYWRVLLGPVAFGWLRADWNNPIVLPRQSRRRLLRGKTVHVAGLEHRRLRGGR